MTYRVDYKSHYLLVRKHIESSPNWIAFEILIRDGIALEADEKNNYVNLVFKDEEHYIAWLLRWA